MSFEIGAIKSIAANRALTKRGSKLFDRKRLTEERSKPVNYRARAQGTRQVIDMNLQIKGETVALLVISMILVAALFWSAGLVG